MLGTAEPEIREQFEQAVALVHSADGGLMPLTKARAEGVRDALGWILGEYTERPIE